MLKLLVSNVQNLQNAEFYSCKIKLDSLQSIITFNINYVIQTFKRYLKINHNQYLVNNIIT